MVEATQSGTTFRQILARLVESQGSARAIAAPGRAAMSYFQLGLLAESVHAHLNGIGIGRGDRIAIVLPDGPEAAAAFLTVACSTCVAPINPNSRQRELCEEFSAVRATAVLTCRDVCPEAVEAARNMGLPLIDLAWNENDPSGLVRSDTGRVSRARWRVSDMRCVMRGR